MTQSENISTDPRYYFDSAAADRVSRFFEKILTHGKGEWAGKPFILEGWQSFVRDLFGWKRVSDGTRRYRQAFIMIPRKNGKSTLAGGLADYLLIGDNEPGAQIYCCASDQEQASVVFREAKRMLDTVPKLKSELVIETFKDSIVCLSSGSVLRALTSTPDSKHGLDPHAVIFDELHTFKNRDLYDTMHTAMGSRRQPLEIMITTAGQDKKSLCYDMYDYACKVRDGVIDDPEFLPIIFEAAPEDDWTDPKVWAKANPNLEKTVKLDFLHRECKKALNAPGHQNSFRQLYLNQWVEQENRWLELSIWDEGAGALDWTELSQAMQGRACYAGVDLSSTMDLTAFVLMFPPEEDNEPWVIIPRFYIPRVRMLQRIERDRVPYDQWIKAGAIVATDSNAVDYNYMKKDILHAAEIFDLREIAFDRFNATDLMLTLQDEGLPVIQVPQTMAAMNMPSKQFEVLVVERKLAHGNHPIMRWMVSNAVLQTNAVEDIKPSKEKSRDKIDGVVAAIMALGRATARGNEKQGPSVYESRGVLTL